MPQVRIATAANHFGAPREAAVIRYQRYVVVVDRLPEARPAGAGLVFGLGVEERLPTADAAKDAVFLGVGVFTAAGALGSFAACDVELFGRQELFPFIVGF